MRTLQRTLHLKGARCQIAGFRSGWTLLLAASVLASFGVIYYFNAWHIIGLPSYVPAFLDWHGVVAASDCAKQGFNVYFENPCDALNRVHNYGSLWLNLNSLGLTRQNQWETGLIISTSFLVAACIMLHPRTFQDFALCLAAIDAPAVMFGVEQANADLLIFVVLLATTFLFSRADRRSQVLAIAIFVVLSLLKFYPAAAIVLIFWTLPNFRTMAIASISVAFAMITWAIIDYDNLRLLYSVIEKPGLGSNLAIGSSLFFIAVRNEFPTLLTWLSGTWASMASFFVLAAAASYCGSRLSNRFQSNSPIRVDEVQFIAGSAIMVFAFFAVTNYDYRCVFLLLGVPFLIRSIGKKQNADKWERRVAGVTLGLVLAVLWSTGVVNLINSSPEQRSILLLITKYVLSWTLIFMLMTINAAFLWRRWNELTRPLTNDRLSIPLPKSI